MIDVKFKKTHERGRVPAYHSETAAGMDLHALNSVTLYGESIQLIRTGISVEFPDWVGYHNEDTPIFLYNLEAQIRARSSLARQGIVVANSPGTIDSDYRGELKILLHNTNANPFEIVEGDRIAQLVFSPVLRVTPQVVVELSETERGAGGFGSTDSNVEDGENLEWRGTSDED